MTMDLYKKSDLPEKSYFKAMAGSAVRGHIKTARQIFKDKVNKENINIAIKEFEDFCNPKYITRSDSYKGRIDCVKEIYEMLTNFKI